MKKRLYIGMGTSSLALIDQGISSATNFLTGAILGRTLTQEAFGIYVLGFSIIIFILDAQTSIISTPYMIKYYRLEKDSRARYTGSLVIQQGMLSLAILFFLALGARYFSSAMRSPGLKTALFAISISIPFFMLRENLRRISFTKLMVKEALILDLLVGVFQLGALFMLSRTGKLSPNKAFYFIGIASLFGALVWYQRNRHQISFSVGRDQLFYDFLVDWKIGKWILVSGLAWTISMSLYSWLLAYFNGTSAAGVWGACYGVVSLGNPVLLELSNFVGPRIAKVYSDKGRLNMRRYVRRTSAIFGMIMLMLATIFLLKGEFIIGIIYGAKYEGNAFSISILGISLIFVAIGYSVSRGLFVLERADLDFRVNLISIIIMLSIGLWLISRYSVIGASVCLLFSSVIVTVARFIAFNKYSSS